jgi:hypothetical protein
MVVASARSLRQQFLNLPVRQAIDVSQAVGTIGQTAGDLAYQSAVVGLPPRGKADTTHDAAPIGP